MFRATREAVSVFVETFEPVGPVLEIGSYLYLGLDGYPNVRPLFPGRDYVGTDIRWGPGVDRLENAEQLSFDDSSFGTVLAFDILEHIKQADAAIAEARRVLRDDGLLVVAVPCCYRIHGFPTDYWRFTSSGLDAKLAQFDHRVVFALGPLVNPALVFGVAGGQGVVDFDERAHLYKERIEANYRAPMSRLRGHASVAKRLGRDTLGWMLGRARLDAAFFDPEEPEVYEVDPSLGSSPAARPTSG